MNITLGYARQVLAQYADSGYCSDSDRVVDCINNAVERLLIQAPADASTLRMRFCVTNGCITLPREVDYLLKVNVCRRNVPIQNRWFEFLAGGPGSLDFDLSCAIGLADMGDGFKTHTDIITPRQVMVTCDVPEDVDARILIRGADENGKEVQTLTYNEDETEITGRVVGEYVELDSVSPRYTASKFSTITSVVKPITNGYVYLSAYDPDDETNTFSIATYHPYEERPSYRRYFVTGGNKNYSTIIALAKLRFVPAIHDSDPLLVQNLPAIQHMMQAMNYFNAGDMEAGMQNEIKAVGYYVQQIENQNMSTTQIDFSGGMNPGDVEGVF